LAEAIAETLRAPPDPEHLKEAVARFSPASSLAVYIDALGLA
jgi:hypothetical protein